MNKKAIIAIVFVYILALSCIGIVGFMLRSQRHEIAILTEQIHRIEERLGVELSHEENGGHGHDNEAFTQQEGKGVPVQSDIVEVAGREMVFTHMCDGVVSKPADDGLLPYCVGKSTLEYRDSTGRNKHIASIQETDAILTPVFKGALLVPSNGQMQTILLSFDADYCAITHECGWTGATSIEYEYAFSVDTMTVRELKEYPKNSRLAAWNPSGTKALFFANTCFGDGCAVAQLVGYNLVKDDAAAVTEAMAAASMSEDEYMTYVTPAGEEVAVWNSVEWTSDTAFSAVILTPEGKKNIIKGTF